LANSIAFREAMALAGSALCTHVNVASSDPGATGAGESTGARGPITWVGGVEDGTVTGNELTLTAPAGTWTHVSLFGGLSGQNFKTSYLLPTAVVLAAPGPIKVVPTFVYPA
jgi:hypothetical protein